MCVCYLNLFCRLFVCLLLTICVQTMTAQTTSKFYQDGKIFLKLKETSQIQLPSINSKSELKEYPYFNELFLKVKTNKIFQPFTHLKSEVFQDLYQIEFEKNEQIEDFIKDLKKDNRVEYVEPVPIDEVFFTPNDAYCNYQWYLEKIQAFDAWDISMGSNEVVVAIVDDAIKTTHEDLMNNVWTNEEEIPNNGVDDDNNGYIDDYQGWDMADNDNDTNPPANSPYFRHGTHVSGLVAAQSNNTIGIASIGSSGIKILPIKATQNDAGMTTQITHGWQGISYAIAMGVDIINISWGSKASSQTYQSIINDAHDQGIIIVAAAGNNNDNKKVYPAAYNHVLAVAATNHTDNKLSVSSYGDWVDVSAPGSAIISTGSISNDAYENNTGTSMAAPLVASLLGLMKSYDNTSSIEDLTTCLLANTDPIQDTQYAASLGTGRINAYEAIHCLLTASCEIPDAPIVNQLSSTTADMSWANVGSDEYQIAYKLAVSSKWTFIQTEETSTSLQGLSAEQTYIIKVASICGDIASDFSSSTTFTTKPIECAKPTDLNLKIVSSQQVRIGWSIEDDSNVETYRIRYKKTKDAGWKTITATESPLFINDLEEAQTYEIQVACNCTGKQGEFSENISFYTQNPHDITSESGLASQDGRSEIQKNIVGLQAYPNPSNGRFYLSFSKEEANNSVLSVYDILGRLVYNQNLTTQEGVNRFEIDLSQQAKGRYILELSETNQSLKQSILLY